MALLIKNVTFDDAITDVLVEGKRFKRIAKAIAPPSGVTTIDGTGKAIIPGFVNGHTHAAMTLFRGFGDDMPLEKWLQEKIWPYEARLTKEMVYVGTKLACLEMIKGGTTFFQDMYWHTPEVVRAVEEMGIRAKVSSVLFDIAGEEQRKTLKAQAEKRLEEMQHYPETISLALSPHAIYTVSTSLLKWAKKAAEKHNVMLHIHAAETQTEVENSITAFGCRPIEYLDKIGFLDCNVTIAHAIWLLDHEIELLAKRGVKIIYNPISNLKLASGYNFRYADLIKSGVTVGLGTDGASSNNNLSMMESMKFASLLQKGVWNDPTLLSAEETLHMATKAGGTIFNLPIGEIAAGTLADFSLVDLTKITMTPNHNLASNLVYSAGDNVFDTVVCNGKVVMQNGIVPGEKEIKEQAHSVTAQLFSEKQ